MKYIIRAIKYFFYFALLTTALVTALVLIGAVESNIEAIFEGGYTALWKMAAFFGVVAAAYPSLAFIKRNIPAKGEFSAMKAEIKEYMQTLDLDIQPAYSELVFDIDILLYAGKDHVRLRIANHHTNIVLIEKNGEVLLEKPVTESSEDHLTDKSCLTIEKISRIQSNRIFRYTQ